MVKLMEVYDSGLMVEQGVAVRCSEVMASKIGCADECSDGFEVGFDA